jgi:hypothetical protein
LAGLAALGTTIGGTGAVAGALIVPYPNSVTSEGSIPGSSDLHYRLDADTGLLSFSHETAAATELAALARQGQDGIFFDTETGIPVARNVGGSLVFDAASLADVAEDKRARSQADAAVRAGAEARTDSPQLCPDPGPDVPHGASPRAIAYQAQISALNNPERPLPPGVAVSLSDPASGKPVVFDDCRESDGTMIEAKGPGYAKLLQSRYFSEEVLPYRWRTQAAKQISASGGRGLDWFFAEEATASKARDVFKEAGLTKIDVFTVPAVMP